RRPELCRRRRGRRRAVLPRHHHRADHRGDPLTPGPVPDVPAVCHDDAGHHLHRRRPHRPDVRLRVSHLPVCHADGDHHRLLPRAGNLGQMMRNGLARLGTLLAWFGAVALFVLSPAIGSISSIAGVVVAILLLPAAFRRGAWRQLQAQPAMLIFLAAFLSIAICYQATAQHPTDVLLAINFLALPLAPVIYLVASRSAGARTIAIVAGLFAAASIAAVLMGSYDLLVEHRERAFGIAQGGNLMARTVVLLGFMGMAGI